MTTTSTPKAKAKATPKPAAFVPTSLEEAQALLDRELKAKLAAEWTDEKIRIRIDRLLNDKFDHIVAVACGFGKNSWGNKWEVDHCNGRGGESLIGQRIAKLAEQAINDMLVKQRDRFELNKQQIDALAKDFHDRMTGYKARERISQLADSKLDRLVQTLNGNLSGADN